MLNIKKDSKLASSVNLTIIQLCMFVIPLVATPFIVSRVGITGYGKFMFFQSVMGLLGVLGNYGFQQTGVRDVANARTLEELNSEFSRIFYSKVFTFLISFTIASFLFALEPFRNESPIYSYSFLFLAVSFLDVSFVYQGIEKLKDYVLANLLGNICYLFLLFVFIAEEKDYVYLPLVFAVPRVLASLFSFAALGIRFGIRPAGFKGSDVINKIRSGFSFFCTNIFAIFYTKTNVIFLGLITTSAFVGYYAIAEQIVFAYCAIQGKVSTVYQPQINAAFERDFNHGVLKARENLMIVLLMSMAAFLFVQFFSLDILRLLFRENAVYANNALRIMSLNFIVLNVLGVLGVQIMLSLYRDHELLKPTVYAGLSNLVLSPLLIYWLRHIGAALSIVIVETAMLLYFYKKSSGYGVKILEMNDFKKLSSYAGFLLVALTGLKLTCLYSPFNMVVDLFAVMAVFALYTLVLLRALKIVDFRNRKVVFSNANE